MLFNCCCFYSYHFRVRFCEAGTWYSFSLQFQLWSCRDLYKRRVGHCVWWLVGNYRIKCGLSAAWICKSFSLWNSYIQWVWQWIMHELIFSSTHLGPHRDLIRPVMVGEAPLALLLINLRPTAWFYNCSYPWNFQCVLCVMVGFVNFAVVAIHLWKEKLPPVGSSEL